ncbi:MAG: TIGR02444 family protein [Porticoccus sp.]
MKKLGSNTENSFWIYSLSHYARSGVAEHCLQYQDKYDANVNMLLLCCWLGSCGIEITNKDLTAAGEKIKQWDHCAVQPLRRVRRFVAVSALIKNSVRVLKELEVTAEKVVQEILYRWAKEQHFIINDAVNTEWQMINLNNYLTMLNAPEILIGHPLLFHASLPQDSD